MLRIRLQRVGRKHEPTFRVVLTDSRNSSKSGKILEVLGSHDPRGERVGLLDKERILHLISKGALPTDTVHNLLVKRGIITGAKVDVSAKKKRKKGEVESLPPASAEVKSESAVEKKKDEPQPETAKEETKKEEPPKEEKVAQETPVLTANEDVGAEKTSS